MNMLINSLNSPLPRSPRNWVPLLCQVNKFERQSASTCQRPSWLTRWWEWSPTPTAADGTTTTGLTTLRTETSVPSTPPKQPRSLMVPSTTLSSAAWSIWSRVTGSLALKSVPCPKFLNCFDRSVIHCLSATTARSRGVKFYFCIQLWKTTLENHF